MAKFLIIMCAFFAVSMARTVEEDVPEEIKTCTLSIRDAIKDLSYSDKASYTPEIKQQLFKIYRPAIEKLSRIQTKVLSLNKMYVTSFIKTSAGTIIECNDKIGKEVVKIVNDALSEYERISCTGSACDDSSTFETLPTPLPLKAEA